MQEGGVASDNVDGERDPSTAGQHDVEIIGALAKPDDTVPSSGNGFRCFTGRCRFYTTAGDESAIAAISQDDYLRARLTGSSAMYFHQGHQRSGNASSDCVCCVLKNLQRIVSEYVLPGNGDIAVRRELFGVSVG